MEIGLLAGRLGGVEARLEAIRSVEPGRDAGLERAVAGLEQQRRDFVDLEAGFSAVRTEFDEFRRKAGSDRDAERQSFAGEVEARLEGERDLARLQLEQLQIEVEGLRRQNAELASRGVEAETRSLTLESRLGLLEETARHAIERGSRPGEELREPEDTAAERNAIREELVRLRDEDHSLRQVADGQAEELRAGLAAFRAEHSSIRLAIGDQEERQVLVESGLARLEASRLEGEQGVVVLREKFETGYLAVHEEIEKLHELLQQFVDHQAERLGRLEESLDRLDAIESERTSLRHELECFRLEQDAMRRDVLSQSERSRSEVAGLRAEMETRTSSPSPVVAAWSNLLPNSVEDQSLPTANVVELSTLPPQFNLDQLAQDLVLDQLVRPDERSRPERPATILETSPKGAGVPEPSSPKATPASSDITAEYQRLGEHFARSMNRDDRAEMIATARHLVAYTRDHFGDRPLEHALWLRNLGVSLSMGGELDEARALLHRALDLCQVNRESDQFPRAICLIDLTESYLAGGDRRQASALCQQALAILKKASLGHNNPLLMRAQGCMARIGSTDPSPSALRTTSIST